MTRTILRWQNKNIEIFSLLGEILTTDIDVFYSFFDMMNSFQSPSWYYINVNIILWFNLQIQIWITFLRFT